MAKQKRTAKRKRQTNYVIRRTDNIGTGDAETDRYFQEHCFVDTGDLAILRDPEDPRRLVLGRTGSGKTALIQKLIESEDNIIELAPETLSLKHISNSNIIRFFEKIGVHLDVFYMFLWLHIITVELIKKRYNIHDKASKHASFTRIFQQLTRSAAKIQSLQYLEKWGDKFWEQTEERVKEFSEKLETVLTGALGADVGIGTLESGGEVRLTREQKTDVVHRGQEVVNQVQLKDLMNILSLLNEDVFADKQHIYFVVIDRLDEDWAEDEVRYRLIKALIEALRKFYEVRHVKIVIALRNDLLQKVLAATKTTGSQEEKYEASYLELRWTDGHLKDVIDARINHLFKRRYTGASVSIDDILPNNQMDRMSPLEYIFTRTFLRPREVIQFINECLAVADGRTKLTVHLIREAERPYSTKRLRSLYDEWRALYPNLGDYVKILVQKHRAFTIDEIGADELDTFVCACMEENNRTHGPMYHVVQKFFNDKASKDEVLFRLLYFLYEVGVVGVKTDAYSEVHWSFRDAMPVTLAQFSRDCKFQIHQTFWMPLGITTG